MTTGREDEREFEPWKRAFAAERSAGSADCPPDELLAELATGALAGEPRARLADHVVACRRCEESYRLLVELDREAAPLPARPRRRRWLGAAAAAALALALAAGVVLFRPTPPAGVDDRPRGSTPEVRRHEPLDGSRQIAPPAQFAWTREAGETRYHVVLYDAELTRLWTSEPTAATRVELPAGARAALDPGAVYFWRLGIETPAGWRDGPLFRFELAP